MTIRHPRFFHPRNPAREAQQIDLAELDSRLADLRDSARHAILNRGGIGRIEVLDSIAAITELVNAVRD